MSIGEAAEALRLSHAAVSQTAREMIDEGVIVAGKDRADERRTKLTLTADGQALLHKLAPLWADIRSAVDEVIAATEVDIISTLSRLERAIDEESIAARTRRRIHLRALQEVKIKDYSPRFKKDFSRLNLEWIEKYFVVEPSDLKLFADPTKYILKPGGDILF